MVATAFGKHNLPEISVWRKVKMRFEAAFWQGEGAQRPIMLTAAEAGADS